MYLISDNEDYVNYILRVTIRPMTYWAEAHHRAVTNLKWFNPVRALPSVLATFAVAYFSDVSLMPRAVLTVALLLFSYALFIFLEYTFWAHSRATSDRPREAESNCRIDRADRQSP